MLWANIARSLLVYIATYGYELYDIFQHVIEDAIKNILDYFSNYCRNVAYWECIISIPGLRLAKLRAKTITMWVSNTSVIGILLDSTYIHQGVTWMMDTRRWLKTILHTLTPCDILRAISSVVNAINIRFKLTYRSSINHFRQNHRICCVIPV